MISNAGKISPKHRGTRVGLSNSAVPGKQEHDDAI
jgi:hypothetical protein